MPLSTIDPDDNPVNHKIYDRKSGEKYVYLDYDISIITLYYQKSSDRDIVKSTSGNCLNWTDEVPVVFLGRRLPVFTTNVSNNLFDRKDSAFLGTTKGDIYASSQGSDYELVCKACTDRRTYDGISTIYRQNTNGWISADTKGRVLQTTDLKTWTKGTSDFLASDPNFVVLDIFPVKIPKEKWAVIYKTKTGVIQYYFATLDDNTNALSKESGPYNLLHVIEGDNVNLAISGRRNSFVVIGTNPYFKVDARNGNWNTFVTFPREVTESMSDLGFRLNLQMLFFNFFNHRVIDYKNIVLGPNGALNNELSNATVNRYMVTTVFPGNATNFGYFFNRNSKKQTGGIKTGYNGKTKMLYVDRRHNELPTGVRRLKCIPPYNAYYESFVEQENLEHVPLYAFKDGAIHEIFYNYVYSIVFLAFTYDPDFAGFDVFSKEPVTTTVSIDARQ